MLHFVRCLVVPVLVVLGISTYWVVRQQPSWLGFNRSTSGDPVDPLDRGDAAKFLHTPTRWQARGRDQSGRTWQGYLYVDQAPENYFRAGFFEWTTGPESGRYHFEGTFDPATRAVKWTGYCIEDRSGLVSMAHYRAVLSADGRKLENGSWSGGISIPGKWTAESIDD